MKIVLFTSSFLPRVGGREFVVHHLALALRELGHDVRVVVPGGWWRYRRERYPYPVWHLPGGGHRLVQMAELTLLTVLGRADVLHAHSTYPAGYLASRVKRLTGIPLVITPHGIDIHTIPEIGHGSRLDPVKRARVDAALGSADVMTAISGSIEDSLLAAGAERSLIRRVPNGIELRRFRDRDGRAARAHLGIPADARVVLTVGNYFRRRGFEELIDGFAGVVRQHPDAYLVIVGKGTEVLRPKIDELALSERVCLTGPVAPPDPTADLRERDDLLADLYGTASVYVSAGMAQGAEGLSLALLDAMAARLPIVATAISGNMDVIRNGDTGLLVAPKDAEDLGRTIARVLAEPARAACLAARAFQLAAGYDWSEVAQQYLRVYDEAMRPLDRSRARGR